MANHMQNRQTLVLATSNPNKVHELDALLRGRGWQVKALSEIVGPVDIPETGNTLRENAVLKARAALHHTGFASLADDTGLEVDALQGRPGVYSARYAGLDADDAANRALLLKELAHVQQAEARTARFCTELAFIDPSGELRVYTGLCEGCILFEERGSGGFGYDALFQPDGYEQSFAELSAHEKNRISHRGRALRAFLKGESSR